MSIRWRGKNWYIRYYGPDGRQREEVIGPNRKEAETVLHQRLYEVRAGLFPILRRRSRITFADHAHEWMTKVATARVRASTKATYQWLLDDHLLPAFGEQVLTTIAPEMIHAHAADELERARPEDGESRLGVASGDPRSSGRVGTYPVEPGPRGPPRGGAAAGDADLDDRGDSEVSSRGG